MDKMEFPIGLVGWHWWPAKELWVNDEYGVALPYEWAYQLGPQLGMSLQEIADAAIHDPECISLYSREVVRG